ncbi:rab11 family-interacting protein 3 isoform X2 [Denticeps clupeoides]|uniref:rab11 family-interacting protein 3 isoform X2 n=1 Tax=Denticeps clupeoides TaxID=299321 RepID=UPI0010A32CF1|nr:uncharacterized protein LOC114795689 isoform X2 [Denticeps clupeoides]
MEQVLLSSPGRHANWDADQNSLGFLLLDSSSADPPGAGQETGTGVIEYEGGEVMSLNLGGIFQENALNLDLFRTSQFSGGEQVFPWEPHLELENQPSPSPGFPASSEVDAQQATPPMPSEDREPPAPSEDQEPPAPSEDSEPPAPSEDSEPATLPTPSEDREPPTPSEDREPPTPSEDREPPTPSEDREPPTPSEDREPATPPTPSEDREPATPPTPSEDRDPPTPSEDREPPTPSEDREPATPPTPSEDREPATPPTPSEDREPPTPSEDREPPTPSEDREPPTPSEDREPPTASEGREPATPPTASEDREPATPPTPSENREPATPPTASEGREPATPPTASEDREPATPPTPSENREPATPPTPSEDREPPTPSEDREPPTPSEDREPATPPTPSEGREPPTPSEGREPPTPSEGREPPTPSEGREPPTPSEDSEPATPPTPSEDSEPATPPTPSEDREPPTPNEDRGPATPPTPAIPRHTPAPAQGSERSFEDRTPPHGPLYFPPFPAESGWQEPVERVQTGVRSELEPHTPERSALADFFSWMAEGTQESHSGRGSLQHASDQSGPHGTEPTRASQEHVADLPDLEPLWELVTDVPLGINDSAPEAESVACAEISAELVLGPDAWSESRPSLEISSEIEQRLDLQPEFAPWLDSPSEPTRREDVLPEALGCSSHPQPGEHMNEINTSSTPESETVSHISGEPAQTTDPSEEMRGVLWEMPEPPCWTDDPSLSRDVSESEPLVDISSSETVRPERHVPPEPAHRAQCPNDALLSRDTPETDILLEPKPDIISLEPVPLIDIFSGGMEAPPGTHSSSEPRPRTDGAIALTELVLEGEPMSQQRLPYITTKCSVGAHTLESDRFDTHTLDNKSSSYSSDFDRPTSTGECDFNTDVHPDPGRARESESSCSPASPALLTCTGDRDRLACSANQTQREEGDTDTELPRAQVGPGQVTRVQGQRDGSPAAEASGGLMDLQHVVSLPEPAYPEPSPCVGAQTPFGAVPETMGPITVVSSAPLREVFQALDQDGDGFVRMEEFMEFAAAYGAEHVKDLTRFLDPSGLGVISFEDFHRGITAISSGGSDPDLYRLELSSVDTTGPAEEYDEQAEVSDSMYLGSESAYSECETFTDEDTGALAPPELHEDVETDSGIENTLTEGDDSRNRYSLSADLHGHALTAVIGGEEEHFEDFGESNTSELLLANHEEGRAGLDGDGDPEPPNHPGSPLRCPTVVTPSSGKRLSSKKAARLLQSSTLGLDGMGDLAHGLLDLSDTDLTDKVLLLERRVCELEQDSQTSEEQHARLRQDNLTLVHRANALEEQLKEQELRSEETLLSHSRKHRDTIAKLQRERDLEIENLQARLQQLDEENSELRSCVPCLRANIERLEEEKLKLQDEVEDISDRLNEELESRRKMTDKLSHERHSSQKEKESTQELIEDLRKQLEHLQLFKLEVEAKRGRCPSVGLQEYNTRTREHELEQEIRRLKQDNRSLKEQNDELNGQIINLSIQGAKNLVTTSFSESLAAEINSVSRSELMEAIHKQEEINYRLQDYIDRIIVAIMESNPSILEVK